MNRRDLVRLLCCLPATVSVSALAQQPVVRAIGFLNGGSRQAFEAMVRAFLSGLKEGGFEDGRDLVVEYRWADGDYSRLPQLATELVRRRVEVIVATGGDVAALAAQRATADIPIVFNIGGDPVRLGLVEKLSRPGRNITGVVMFTFELATKRLEILRELAPKAQAVGALFNPTRPNADARLGEVVQAASLYGLRVVPANAASDLGIEAAFARLRGEELGGILIGSDPFFSSRRQRLVELVAQLRVPAVYESREFAVAGGLVSYGTSLQDAYRQVGLSTASILRGEKAAELPVVQSVRFELVVNLKSARSLGLDLPPTLMAQADEVIE